MIADMTMATAELDSGLRRNDHAVWAMFEIRGLDCGSPPQSAERAPTGGRGAADQDVLQRQFERECAACDYEIRPGPAKLMKWGVPDGARDPATGELLHDDLLMSAALCAALDHVLWLPQVGAVATTPADPIVEMDLKY